MLLVPAKNLQEKDDEMLKNRFLGTMVFTLVFSPVLGCQGSGSHSATNANIGAGAGANTANGRTLRSRNHAGIPWPMNTGTRAISTGGHG